MRRRGRGADNHNGGAIHFGTDGKLYVAVGDNKRDRAAQSMGTLLGKMLRINADGSIPEDNPFYDTASGNNRAIWAKGLRNPYTFAIQRGTGKIHINDVGQERWEEVNAGEAGANYGWPRVEGLRSSRFAEPVFAYRHGSGPNRGCTITGGAFYNPEHAQLPIRLRRRLLLRGLLQRLDPGARRRRRGGKRVRDRREPARGPEGGPGRRPLLPRVGLGLRREDILHFAREYAVVTARIA